MIQSNNLIFKTNRKKCVETDTEKGFEIYMNKSTLQVKNTPQKTYRMNNPQKIINNIKHVITIRHKACEAKRKNEYEQTISDHILDK